MLMPAMRVELLASGVNYKSIYGKHGKELVFVSDGKLNARTIVISRIDGQYEALKRIGSCSQPDFKIIVAVPDSEPIHVWPGSGRRQPVPSRASSGDGCFSIT
jgi:hypothetical protein